MRLVASASLLALVAVSPRTALAQSRDSTPLEHRVSEVIATLAGSPIAFDTVFAPVFLSQVPPAQLLQLSRQLSTQLGAVTNATRVPGAADTPTHADYRLSFSKGFTLSISIDVAATPPALVDGLLFGTPTRDAVSLDALMHDFAALPGHVSVLAARIEANGIVPIAAVDSGRALGLGSAFKLYILAELIGEIENGTRHWSDVVPIDSASRSLSSGILQTWPVGTPITIESLAILMISESDNTAADRLLRLLGRERVESRQHAVGNTHFVRNTPFLTTREMFALKTPGDSTLLRRYLTGTVAARRDVLAGIDRQPYAELAPDFGTGPVAIDSVEWFASASDIARTLLWIRDHTATGAAAPARDVLAVNPGLHWPGDPWKYVAFKGGSEPGVLDLSFLLERNDGQWFVLTATWNNPERAIDEAEFISLVQRAGELLVAEKP